jgi:hypothetical protein
MRAQRATAARYGGYGERGSAHAQVMVEVPRAHSCQCVWPLRCNSQAPVAACARRVRRGVGQTGVVMARSD